MKLLLEAILLLPGQARMLPRVLLVDLGAAHKPHLEVQHLILNKQVLILSLLHAQVLVALMLKLYQLQQPFHSTIFQEK